MAVFVSYSDETKTGSLSDFLVSGYIADEQSTWPLLTSAWQERVLDGSPNIPYLHMTDIRNAKWRREKGNGISEIESECRISAAVSLLAQCGGLSIVTSAIRRANLESAIRSKFDRSKDVTEALSKPDYFCFHAYCTVVLKMVRLRHSNVDKVNFVVSRKQRSHTTS